MRNRPHSASSSPVITPSSRARERLVAARKVQGRPLLWQLRGAQKISDLDDLARLTASFVGTERAQREFPDAAPGVPITRAAAQRARDLIARVGGASPRPHTCHPGATRLHDVYGNESSL